MQRLTQRFVAGLWLFLGAGLTLGQDPGAAKTPPVDPTLSQNTRTEAQHIRLSMERNLVTPVRFQYLLYLPRGHRERKAYQYPLILFLHGAGERGTKLEKVKVHGPPKIVEGKDDFPFMILSPQCPEGKTWDNRELLELLSEVSYRYGADPKRTYLTGLSMGGYGTWKLAMAYPEKFAAVAPICGGGSTLPIKLAEGAKREALKRLPVWAFHGGKDPVVDVSESERMVDALKAIGATNVKLTVYPDASHDSWTETYNNRELFDWFLRHNLDGNAAAR